MRIISGRFRGTRLAALGKGDVAAHLRPTPDRVRESLFNVLNARVEWDGAVVLDLFAGTGALGLEALSRGAEAVTFVESGRVGQRLIAENIGKLGCGAECTVLKQDALKLRAATVAHDLVFLDPPYGKGLGEKALAAALAGGWLALDALVVWEESAPQEAPEGFVLVAHRRYGDTHLTLLARGVS